MSTANLTSGFVDLATFDQMEDYLYGGPQATAYFVRETRKSTWFTQVPVALKKNNANPNFGQDWSVNLTRSGDYLLNTWLRVVIPAVKLNAAGTFGVNGRIRWTRNLMHNLIKECQLTFNDLVAARFDNIHLDFWTAFTVPASKRDGYDNMIGNVSSLTSPHAANLPVGDTLPQTVLNLPLPFFFSRDSGVALPTAAIPYNDMKIQFTFRDWEELLILDNSGIPGQGTVARAVPIPGTAIAGDLALGAPSIVRADTWATYAIVSNEERKRMGCAPRDMLIEQVQNMQRQTFNPIANPEPTFDIRFSHAIKALFFGVKNTTWKSEHSNYTAASPYNGGANTVNFNPSGAADPIAETSLLYENQVRLSQMTSDYYSLVSPYFTAPSIPTSTGYHMYSYSLNLMDLDPKGSTNYGKLSNVSIVLKASDGAVTGAQGLGAAESGQDFPQKFEFNVTCINNNIIRISSGSVGFPIL